MWNCTHYLRILWWDTLFSNWNQNDEKSFINCEFPKEKKNRNWVVPEHWCPIIRCLCVKLKNKRKFACYHFHPGREKKKKRQPTNPICGMRFIHFTQAYLRWKQWVIIVTDTTMLRYAAMSLTRKTFKFYFDDMKWHIVLSGILTLKIFLMQN